MKLVRLRSIVESLNTQLCLRNVSSISSYSTATLNRSTQRRGSTSNSMRALFRRISPAGNPKASIVPFLDQWVREGGTVDKQQLQVFIKQLRSFRRYSHALQISMWMTDKRYLQLNAADMAIRLDLIHKVKGIEHAENLFNNIPKQLMGLEVYSSLLKCYVNANSVDKAETTMQRMRDLGLATKSLAYNSLLNLYYKNGNFEKLDRLMHEMEAKGIGCDKVTYRIRVSACAAASDVKGIDNIMKAMESDQTIVSDWEIYATAASGYAKCGSLDKALLMLKKSEGLVVDAKGGRAYDFLITLYAKCGKKDEVLRLWELYKKNVKVYNRVYSRVLSSLLKFDDVQGAEKIFEEWESEYVFYDFRIPNFLIGVYCKKGLLQKAKTLIHRGRLRGGKPDSHTWFFMAMGYLKNNEFQKAVDTLKEALVLSEGRWKPSKKSLAACLEYLKDKGDLEGAEKIIKLLRDKDIISVDLRDRLLNNVYDAKSNLDALN